MPRPGKSGISLELLPKENYFPDIYRPILGIVSELTEKIGEILP